MYWNVNLIRITDADFQKLKKVLEKEGQTGASLTFRISGTKLEIETFDRQNKSMIITLSDAEYTYLPTITKTESF